MLTQIKRFGPRMLRDYRYAIYVCKNVHFIRCHFPRFYAWISPRRRGVCLGEERRIERLHVILRTTDMVMSLNANRQLEPMGVFTKRDVIRVGGCSLFPAARKFQDEYGVENLKVTLVTDNMSNDGLSLYASAAEKERIAFDIVESRGHGNGPSFQTQIDIAMKDDDRTLLLILEDDYLLDENALVIPFDLMRKHSKIIGFNPHFHPGTIRFQNFCELTVISNRLYCQVPSTCCTFFMARADLARYERDLRLYDGWENGSVNCAWQKELCLAPIGWTLAEHLHKSDLSPVQNILSES